MVLAMAGFAVNDAFIKSVGETLQLGQSLMIRGIFASIFVFFLAIMLGQWRSPSKLVNPVVGIRLVGELVATATFVFAIFNMPIGNATAILQALPLALTAAAAIFLREKVGWRRLLSVLIGFVGVLIVVRPGLNGFTVYSLLVLLSVAGCVLRDLATRAIDRAIPSMMITFSTAVAVAIMGGIIALFQEWLPVGIMELLKMMASSIFLIVGYYFIINAMRVGDIAFVAPYRYSILLFAMIAGYFVFNERPDALTLLGFALIVGTGIYTLYRERRVRRQAITPPPQR